ncbi:MAG: AAA family ATPase [Actinomycetota bacterium]|nr:AAA family ATPase [Actinomycetota bacterium]
MAGSLAAKAPYNPILLRALVAQVGGMSQGEISRRTGYGKSTINLTLSTGILPSRVDKDEFMSTVESYVQQNPEAMRWLKALNAGLVDLWRPVSDFGITVGKQTMPVDLGKRQMEVRRREAVVPGNPHEIIMEVDREMLSMDAKKQFQLFKNPFIDDVAKESDVFMSDEHRYIQAAMLDAAKHRGCIAVIGEVGSGKSTIRKKVMMELEKSGEQIKVCYPQIIDKKKLTVEHLCNAVIMDFGQTPKQDREAKARQVIKLLTDRAKAGGDTVLMVEEAHDLSVPVLKYLKRFSEIELGYRKVIGIILIGQPELGDLFDERMHFEMREVTRRFQIAHISGLNGNMGDYLELKFKLAGAEIGEIITKDAITALSKRLTTRDAKERTASTAYPLTVNNYIVKAMNLAAELGEPIVNAEVINQL